MWKSFLTIIWLVGLTAAESTECSEEFALKHGALFAIPGSCDKYLACARGHLAEFSCPPGAVFDVNSSRCSSDPQAKCAEENWAVADGVCSNLDEALAIPDPHRCTSYVLCLGEFTIAKKCDHGLLFNSLIGICDTAQNVVCDVTCPTEGDEVTYLPDSTGQNCARYHICENGFPQPAECSTMQYFDLVTETCTNPAESSCIVQGVTCSELDESIANPESCTSYYRCEEGFPHLMECDAEHHFFDGQCVPGDCDDFLTDDTEGTTDEGTTSEPVTQSTIATPTESPSTITTGSPPATPEITTESTTTTQSTITMPSTITTELPVTTPEFTTEVSTETQSTIVTPTDSPSTITTELPSTTPELTTEQSTATQSTIGTPTITTELPVTTPEITTILSTETQTPTGTPSTITTPPTTLELTTELSTATQSTIPTPTTESPVATTPENTTPIITSPTPSTITTTSTQTVESSTVTGEATTATTDTPSTDPAVVCQGVDIGIFAHPFNCYQYFVCIFDAGWLFTCGNGQIFDPLLVCVAGDRETCVRS
ncbi:hypothetical protein RP20_CCG019785 [Aedes albopictus]|nr:hypothetical protein RP20_CCG019785 [Aedes albopictus]